VPKPCVELYKFCQNQKPLQSGGGRCLQPRSLRCWLKSCSEGEPRALPAKLPSSGDEDRRPQSVSDDSRHSTSATRR